MEVTEKTAEVDIFSTLLQWKITRFEEIKNSAPRKSVKFKFLRDQKLFLCVSFTENGYPFTLPSFTYPYLNMDCNFKLHVIDGSGHVVHTVVEFASLWNTTLLPTLICTMGEEFVKGLLIEDTLTVRCHIYIGKLHETPYYPIEAAESLDTENVKNFIGQSTQTEDCNPSENVKNFIGQSTQTEDCNPSGTSSVNFLSSLSTDLEVLYKEQADTDCVLITNEMKLPAHRAVLSARSTVFSAMFHHDTAERQTGEVSIPDVEASILRDVVHFIYTGRIRGMSPDTAVRLYIAADKYALHELRAACLEYLQHNLNIGNICDVAVMAHRHGEEQLEKKVVNFMITKFQKIEESAGWKQFVAENALLATRLLSAALRAKQ